jgi:hypothetical protein
MVFERPKTPAHSAHTPTNPLDGKIYGARRKRKPPQAKPVRIRYPYPCIVRCVPPQGIPVFFGVEKNMPHPEPLSACNDTFFSFRVSRAGVFNGLSAGDTGPLRIPLGKLGAAASPTDKPGKYGALPPVISKRHHYTLAPCGRGEGFEFRDGGPDGKEIIGRDDPKKTANFMCLTEGGQGVLYAE